MFSACLVGDLGTELLLEAHDANKVKGVGIQVIHNDASSLTSASSTPSCSTILFESLEGRSGDSLVPPYGLSSVLVRLGAPRTGGRIVTRFCPAFASHLGDTSKSAIHEPPGRFSAVGASKPADPLRYRDPGWRRRAV